ncbi:hypothetical protein GGR51DRAFT_578509 [Nemania sp. FL0031]|nr:hypothetical protein GGR51DRAFT_578509 [Nemania sp. FL0031]
MADAMHPRTMELAGRWNEASTQLTGFVKTIKMTVLAFNTLGPDGEAYFKEQAGLLSICFPDFIIDESNQCRIYFGNPIDIQQETNGVIYHAGGMGLPVLRPGYNPERSTNLQRASDAGQYFTMNNGMKPVGDPEEHTHARKGKGKAIDKTEVVKQPPNGFVRFRSFYAENLRKQNPEMHQSTISGLAKDKWNGMPAEEQEPWLTEARAEMEQFKAKYPGYFKERAARAMKRKQALGPESMNQPKKQKTITPSSELQTQEQMTSRFAVPVHDQYTQNYQSSSYQGGTPAFVPTEQPHILTPQFPEQMAYQPPLMQRNLEPKLSIRQNPAQMVDRPPAFVQAIEQQQQPAPELSEAANPNLVPQPQQTPQQEPVAGGAHISQAQGDTSDQLRKEKTNEINGTSNTESRDDRVIASYEGDDFQGPANPLLWLPAEEGENWAYEGIFDVQAYLNDLGGEH